MEGMKDKERVQKQFGAYCKRVIKNALIDYRRQINNERKRLVSFSDLSQSEINELICQDTYNVSLDCVSSSKFQVYVENELLHSALNTLRDKDCDIIILAYWLGMKDTEIAEQMNLSRRTVTDIRHRALKKLKSYMEVNNIESFD